MMQVFTPGSPWFRSWQPIEADQTSFVSRRIILSYLIKYFPFVEFGKILFEIEVAHVLYIGHFPRSPAILVLLFSIASAALFGMVWDVFRMTG
jgi:hypothetical protein